MMDLRENTSCETDLDCDAGIRRGRGPRINVLYISYVRTQLYFSDTRNFFFVFSPWPFGDLQNWMR